MGNTVEAMIQPALLVWARERAGLQIEAAAKKAQVKADRLASWESGETRPSVAQLRRLGTVYKRPIAVFYLPRPPKGFDPLHDFRRLPASGIRERSPQLTYEIRRAQERRDLALELFEAAEGESPPEVSLEATPHQEPEHLAGQIRAFLGIDYDEQVSWNSVELAFKRWRAALEEHYVLVFQAPRIKTDEMRGFSITEMPLPAVVLNSKDGIAARVFTMLHEFSHIVIRNGGLCDLGDDATEVFCNRVAGAALVPAERLVQEPVVTRTRDGEGWEDRDVNVLAKRYGVSREVILRRLLILGRTTERFYRAKRDQWKTEFEKREPQKGGPAQHVLVVNRAGPFFTRLVLTNYHQENITASDVADFLAVKLKYLPKIEAEVTGPRGGVAA